MSLTTDGGARSISRRKLIKRGGVLAGATALIGGTQIAGKAAGHQLNFDVACNGGTFILNRAAGSDP